LKVWEEILQRLRNNEPLEAVRRDCRSDSQFAKAIREYNDEMVSEAEKIRETRLQEEQNLTVAKAENKQMLAEKKVLEQDVQSRRAENSVVLAEVKSGRETVEEVKVEAEALEKAGFSSDVMGIVKNSWVRNGAEAVALLQDLDKATELRVEVQNLSEKEVELERSTSLQEKKLQNIYRKLASEKNQLDVIKTEVRVLQNVVSVVKAGMRRGYSPEQLVSIFSLLETMEIQKQPIQSIMRLVEAICAAKNLATLKGEEDAVGKRVEQLHIVEAEIETRLELQNSRFLGSLDDHAAKGKEAIASVTDQSLRGIRSVASEMAEKARIANEATTASILDIGKMEQQKRALEPQFALLGLSPQTGLAEKIPPDLVVLLLENVKHWLDQKFPNMNGSAGYDCLANKFVSNPWANPIPIVAYLEFTIDCIKEGRTKELKNKTKADGGEK
jgi:hypothetical protein